MEHTHPVYDMDNHFIIDPITRAVTNAGSAKNILMQNDHNSECFSFEIDKLVEGHDLTLCNRVEVHYNNTDLNKKNTSLGVYEVEDLTLSEDGNKVTFTWTVSENATLYAGSLNFLILFACVENGVTTYRWNTNINNSISIAKGMYNGEAIAESYPDILNQWKQDLFAATYGFQSITIGPTPPETYPYLWFDTSDGYGQNVGAMTIKDGNGTVYNLFPVTKIESIIDLMDTLNSLVDEMQAEIVNELQAKLKQDVIESVTPESIGAMPEDALPNSHASTHTADGSDPITPASIGAATEDHTHTPASLGAAEASVTTIITLLASGWSTEDNTLTVSVPVISAVDTIIIGPAPESHIAYNESGIYCSGQADGQLSFICSYIPEIDLIVNVLIVG